MQYRNMRRGGIIILLITVSLLCSILNVYAASDIDILLSNMGPLSNPLIEYSDPIVLAEDYSSNIQGQVELFLENWALDSIVTTKSEIWEKAYEDVLLDVLSDESVLEEINALYPEGGVLEIH